MKEQIYHGPINLNYIEGPTHGAEILLLHGGSNRWQSFLPILPDLMTNFHIYAIDMRGHGKSERANSYTMRDHADDLVSFIKNQIQKPVIIFGNSLGGMVATIIAAKHPELVQAIIIGDTPLTLVRLRRLIDEQRDFAHQIIHWLATNNVETLYKEIKNDYFAESLTQCDPSMLSAMFDDFDNTFGEYKPRALFPFITCPFLVIRGNVEQGSLISDTDMNEALQSNQHIIQVQLPKVGHSIMEDKEALIKAINAFVEKLNKL